MIRVALKLLLNIDCVTFVVQDTMQSYEGLYIFWGYTAGLVRKQPYEICDHMSVWLCSSKTLFLGTTLSYNFHGIKYYFDFYQLFENLKNILSL